LPKKEYHLKLETTILDYLKTKHHLSVHSSIDCGLDLLMQKLEPTDPNTILLELKKERKSQMQSTARINILHEILKNQEIDPDNFEEEFVFPEIREGVES
jgi:hypothetical protein